MSGFIPHKQRAGRKAGGAGPWEAGARAGPTGVGDAVYACEVEVKRAQRWNAEGGANDSTKG
jgi:hypothetical protein